MRKNNDRKKRSKTQEVGRALTGQPLDKIDVDPELARRKIGEGAVAVSPIPSQKRTQDMNDITELNLMQLIKRGRQARRSKSKMALGRRLWSRKLPDRAKVKKRARLAARDLLVRRRYGKRWSELTLSKRAEASAWLSMPNQIKRKSSISRRLEPRIRKDAQVRIASMRSNRAKKATAKKATATKAPNNVAAMQHRATFGLPLKAKAQATAVNMNLATPKRLNVSQVDSSADHRVRGANIRPLVNSFSLTNIKKKAQEHNLSEEVLLEVYARGWEDYDNSRTTLAREQYAFGRVNSFINKGRAYQEDIDLVPEETEEYKMQKEIFLKKVSTRKEAIVEYAKTKMQGRLKTFVG